MVARSAMLAALALSLSAEASPPVKYRILFQVSENSVDRLHEAIINAKNVMEELGPDNTEVQIVVFGAGVHTLKYYAPIPIADLVKEMKSEGVRFVVCERAMRRFKLRPSDMLPYVQYVPSGVAEIVYRQEEGWVYVRP